MIVYECLDAWEIRIGDELHGLRFTLEAALARARDVAARCRASMSLWSCPIWARLAAMASVISFVVGTVLIVLEGCLGV